MANESLLLAGLQPDWMALRICCQVAGPLRLSRAAQLNSVVFFLSYFGFATIGHCNTRHFSPPLDYKPTNCPFCPPPYENRCRKSCVPIAP